MADATHPDPIPVSVKLLRNVEVFLRAMTAPWRLYQLAGMAALPALAQMLRMIVTPRLPDRVGMRHGWPRWRLRGLFFVLLNRITVWILRAVTRPPLGCLPGGTAGICLT